MLKVFFEIFHKFKENLFCKTSLNNILKVFDNFKNKQKNVWMYNVFRNAKVGILWKFIQYIIHWDKTQMLQKISSDKINGTKNALFFLSWDPTRRKFTFNWRSYMSWSTRFAPLKVCVGFSTSDSVLLLLKFTFLLYIK